MKASNTPLVKTPRMPPPSSTNPVFLVTFTLFPFTLMIELFVIGCKITKKKTFFFVRRMFFCTFVPKSKNN